jgi:hypothetical protein
VSYQSGRWPTIDETGKRYDSWEVVARVIGGNGARWRCRCVACGALRVFYGFALRAGVTAKCQHPGFIVLDGGKP